jgi:salicylate hydroxylase
MNKRAIIAGAGIGGLASALAMSRSNLEIAVCEQADTLEEFGAGLQLTPNATRVLESFGVLEKIRAAATVPKVVVAVRGSDDAPLMRMRLDDSERRWGAPYFTIHRADLQEVLVRAVERRPNVRLELGTAVASVSTTGTKVSVALARGLATSADSSDLLIGADGLHSRVREQLRLGKPDDAMFTGHVAFRATVSSKRIDASWTEPQICIRLGPKAHLVHYPLRSGSIVNLVAVVESAWRNDNKDQSWDVAADRHELELAFARWSAATRRILDAAASWRAWPLFSRPPLGSFSFGNIALVGDAAHPMAPFLAQGAAQAIEDAGALGRIFARTSSISDALAVYSRERVARATRVQREALRQGQLYHLAGPLAGARDFAMRLLGPERLGGRYDWLYGA